MNNRFSHLLVLALALLMSSVWLSGCGNQESRKTAYFEKGKAFFEAGDDSRARLELSNALQIDSRYAEAWHILGRVEQRTGDVQKAYANFSRAVELAPDLVGARVDKAQILLLAEEWEAAETEIEAALAIVQNDPGALVARGALRQRERDLAGAEADARAALASAPNDPGAVALLASVLFENDEIEAVVGVLNEAIAANPTKPDLWLLLGRVYEQQDDSAGVLKVLQGVVEKFPENTDFRFRLASYLVKLQRPDEAEQVLRETLAQSPTDLQRQQALLEFLLQAKGVDAAQEELSKLLESQGDRTSLRLLQAELLKAMGNVAFAETVLRSVIEGSAPGGPDGIKASVALVRLLMADGRNEEAGHVIASALEQSPGEPDILEQRAALALQNNAAVQAVADLRIVLDGEPDRAGAHRLLALAHLQRREEALAQDAFEKAIQLAPNDPVAYLQLAELQADLGDERGALNTLEQLLEKVPDNAPAQEKIAQIQLSGRDWEALSDTAHRIQQGRPDHPLGYYLEGLVLQRQERDKDAVRLFAMTLDRKREAVSPRLAMARSQMALGNWDEARATIDRAQQLNPNNLEAILLLGELQLATGAPEKAEATFREAVRFHPSSPRGYVRLVQLQVSRGEWDSARITLDEGIEATGENGYLLLQKALMLNELGEQDAAIKAYEDLLARYPDALVAVNNLAVLLIAGPNDSAALQRALELAMRLQDSEVPEFLDTLGWAHYLRGDYINALPYLEAAVAGRPEQPEMRLHLGQAYAKLGRLEEARKNLWLAATADGFWAQADAQRLLDTLDEATTP